MSLWLKLTLPTLLLLLHFHSSCQSIVASAVPWIVHGRCLRRQNQGNGFDHWLSGACVFLLIAVFHIVDNSQGGNWITLYSSIEQSYLSLWLHLTLPLLLLLLHSNSCCHSTVAHVVAWIVHGHRLKRQNQSNGFHRWLSAMCVFLLIVVFDILKNSQGGNWITLYYSIGKLQMSLWLHLTLPTVLLLLNCHSICHSTVTPAVALIVHSRRLKRQNQGNGYDHWLSGACVFLLIAVFHIVENSPGGNLITLYYSIEQL